MHSFVYGLLGGALIGLSASVLLLFSGDILGASGIVSSVGLSPLSTFQDPCQHWKIVLIASFFLTANLFFPSVYQDMANGLASLSWAAYLIGGFFVGFGTRLGNGCTSGHGICGLARLSKRSLVAVMTFMSIGILTAYLTQQATTPFPNKDAFAFLRSNDPQEPVQRWTLFAAIVAMIFAAVALVAPSFHKYADGDHIPSNCRTKLAPAAAAGILFSLGLYLSEMVYPVRVFGFLNLALIPQGTWDATLMFVMGGGCAVSFLSYQLVEGYNFLLSHDYIRPLTKPLALSEGSKFCVPTNTIIDRDLIVGAMSFGLGWGISGLCPGPALFLAAIGISWVLVCYWPAFFLGAFVASYLKGKSWNPFQKKTPSSSSEEQENDENKDHSDGNRTSPETTTAAFDLESNSDAKPQQPGELEA